MRNPFLVWYEYPWPHGSGFSASDLFDSDLVAQVFAHAETGAARITAEGWKFLRTTYGLDGLTAVVRRSESFEDRIVRDVTDQLVKQSLLAGYDPVSGFFGRYSEEENSFELVGM